MYGLLLDSIQKFITENYGERCWETVRQKVGLKNRWFVTHEVYSDQVMRDLVAAVSVELGQEPAIIMRLFGEYFVQSVGQYGYARLLRVLGRDLRDFLNGLDDLHEYLRVSYPKMKPPSFYCEQETEHGMLLHYTTSRKGFIEYVIGQLIRVGQIYGKQLEVVQKSLEETGNELHYVLELRFDNRELLYHNQPTISKLQTFSVDSETFLTAFPFCFVYDKELVIQWVGRKLELVLPGLAGRRLAQAFTLQKPHFYSPSWSQICSRCNTVFELVSTEPVTRAHALDSIELEPSNPPLLTLKGEMLLLKETQSIAFLCSPVLESPEDLYQSGIFINDLSKHDSSRDYVLAGSRQNPELNLALHQEKIRSHQLEESSRKTDQLLFQMIPKPIADQLRSGETPLNTCREFEHVSVLFSDIVSFTPMCSRLRPMEVVCVLNAMCVAFDGLCDTHGVYKVEMIGDGYMVICGAPEAQPRHALFITDFACSIIDATSKINDPSTNQPLEIRVGIHSGPVVGGVVGASILRYDVFGDTVNVAARMEATGQPMRIHVSQATATLLKESQFILEQRGRVEVKGKGLMTTYWVEGKKDSVTPLLPAPRGQPPPTSVTHLPPAPRVREPPSLKRVSPEPHEWPLADQLTRRRHTVDTVSNRPPTMPNTPPTMQLSELNLLRIRESLSIPVEGPTVGCPSVGCVPVAPPTLWGVDDLRGLVAMAEESAGHARVVADMAADMMRHVPPPPPPSEQPQSCNIL